MNKLQEAVVQICSEGHNLCLTGQAGTGKTYVVKKIKKALESNGKSVVITCTTGMACMQYKDAQTIHSWAGLQDGRFSSAELTHLLKHDEKFQKCKENILKADVLIIDEVSMLSRMLLERLEEVLRTVRNNSVVFGGVQVVAVGDFYQLQPVPSIYGDKGDTCVLSDIWRAAFPHHINLIEVHRQHQPELVNAVSELARGEPSEKTNALMKKLSRPLSDTSDYITLAARNITVDYINDQLLSQMKCEAFIYEAIDSGDISSLRKVKVQKVLALKKGCPVVLVANLTSPLVNGLRGIVVKLDSTGPTVHFESVNITKKLDRFFFTIYNKGKMTNVATRKQFPLKLSYALTIHRAQGMSLDSVVVDCTNAWKPGQIAVAIGRARTTEGLCVTNYHTSLATKPSDAILEFYNSPLINTVPTSNPAICCRTVITNVSEIILEEDSHTDSDLSEFGSAELEETENIFTSLDIKYSGETPDAPTCSSAGSSTESTSIPEHSHPDIFKPVTIARSLQYSKPDTPAQKKLNSIINTALEKEVTFHNYSTLIWKLLTELYDKCTQTQRKETLSTKELNKFNSEVFSLIHNLKEEEVVRNLFQSYLDDEISFVSKFVLQTAKCLLQWKASLVNKQETKRSAVSRKTMSSDGAGMVRYVGGMCVAKLKYKLINEFHNSVHSKQKKKKEAAEIFRKKIQLLQTMESLYATLVTDSQYPQTLVHTQRRQNERCSLTNISDRSFTFFMELESQRASMSKKQLADEYKQHVLSVVTKQVSENKRVKEKYQESLEGIEEISQDIKHQLYLALVQKYMSVGNNAFRKELMSAFSKKKKVAHRKHISSFTSTRDAEVASASKTELPSSSSEDVGVKRKGKGTGKGKGKGKASKQQRVSKELFFCPTCGKLYEEGQEWIECGKCGQWYDRQCCLISDKEWENLVSTESQWLCFNCVKSSKLS